MNGTVCVAGAVAGGFFAGIAGGAALLAGSFLLFVLAAASAATGAVLAAEAVRNDAETRYWRGRREALAEFRCERRAA